ASCGVRSSQEQANRVTETSLPATALIAVPRTEEPSCAIRCGASGGASKLSKETLWSLPHDDLKPVIAQRLRLDPGADRRRRRAATPAPATGRVNARRCCERD